MARADAGGGVRFLLYKCSRHDGSLLMMFRGPSSVGRGCLVETVSDGRYAARPRASSLGRSRPRARRQSAVAAYGRETPRVLPEEHAGEAAASYPRTWGRARFTGPARGGSPLQWGRWHRPLRSRRGDLRRRAGHRSGGGVGRRGALSTAGLSLPMPGRAAPVGRPGRGLRPMAPSVALGVASSRTSSVPGAGGRRSGGAAARRRWSPRLSAWSSPTSASW